MQSNKKASYQETLTDWDRKMKAKARVTRRAEERKRKFNAKPQSKLLDFLFSDVTVLSDTDPEQKITMSVNKKGIDN